jgi:hypothetical protein
MFLWVRVARGLAERPLLRRAVAAGLVTPRKAEAVFPVALGEDEGAWTAAAMSSKLTDLKEAVRGEGKDPDGDLFESDTLWLPMTPEQQDRLDTAISLARENLGYAALRWRCLEAMCQEFMGSFAEWSPEGEAEEEKTPQKSRKARRRARRRAMRMRARTVERQLRAIEEAMIVVEGLEDDSGSDDALALDARLQRLMAARQGFDEAFGIAVARIVDKRTWDGLGYRSLEEYCHERLGMSIRSVRERVWLERRMCALPEIREALSSGRLTYSKALLVAKDAGPFDVVERIEEAQSRTWQGLERESNEKERRRNRAAGVRRIWGPKDAAETISEAISCARRWSEEQGEVIGAGEALARIADYAVEVWLDHSEEKEKLGRKERDRRDVLMRNRGLCSVPGCSRAADHDHHVKYRSRGGCDEIWNRVGVCLPHHLHGIHRGYLTVTGRAGEHLVWKMGVTEELVPLEVWVTEGDDDVRRAKVYEHAGTDDGDMHVSEPRVEYEAA